MSDQLSMYEIRTILQEKVQAHHNKHGSFILRGFCKCGASGMPGGEVCQRWAKIDDLLINLDGAMGQYSDDEVTARTEVADGISTSDEGQLHLGNSEDTSQRVQRDGPETAD